MQQHRHTSRPVAFLSACILAATLGGCTAAPSGGTAADTIREGPPSAQQLASADYGTAAVTQQDAQAMATAFLKTVLKDPASAQIEWGQVQQGWVQTSMRGAGEYLYGYRMDAKINARNSYGGYTGYKPFTFLFRDGNLFAVWAEQPTNLGPGLPSTYNARIK